MSQLAIEFDDVDWVVVEPDQPDFIKWTEPGQSVVGWVEEMKSINTVNGEAKIAILRTSEDAGRNKVTAGLFITAGLESVFTSRLMGCLVKVVYTGEEKNPKTGRKFKSFDVFQAG